MIDLEAARKAATEAEGRVAVLSGLSDYAHQTLLHAADIIEDAGLDEEEESDAVREKARSLDATATKVGCDVPALARLVRDMVNEIERLRKEIAERDRVAVQVTEHFASADRLEPKPSYGEVCSLCGLETGPVSE